MTKISKSDFIYKCNKIYKNEFDYSNIEYRNTMDKIIINHDLFGLFEQTAHTHYTGKLPKKIKILLSIKDNIKSYEIIDIEDFKSGKSKKGIFKCKTHGNFEKNIPYVKKYNIKNKDICLLCKKQESLNNLIIKFGRVGKYDYSNVDLKNFTHKNYMDIKCKTHGFFKQRANNHFHLNQDCPKCVGGVKLSIDDIRGRTDYKVLDYKKGGNIYLKCDKHGEFIKNISKLYQGCPECNIKSYGEKKILEYLIDNNIKYEIQKDFENCLNKRHLKFDFYLPKQNICIEFDGKQHFELNNFFGGEKSFKELKINDGIKNDYCQYQNIKLIRIPYFDFDNIQEILELNM